MKLIRVFLVACLFAGFSSAQDVKKDPVHENFFPSLEIELLPWAMDPEHPENALKLYRLNELREEFSRPSNAINLKFKDPSKPNPLDLDLEFQDTVRRDSFLKKVHEEFEEIDNVVKLLKSYGGGFRLEDLVKAAKDGGIKDLASAKGTKGRGWGPVIGVGNKLIDDFLDKIAHDARLAQFDRDVEHQFRKGIAKEAQRTIRLLREDKLPPDSSLPVSKDLFNDTLGRALSMKYGEDYAQSPLIQHEKAKAIRDAYRKRFIDSNNPDEKKELGRIISELDRLINIQERSQSSNISSADLEQMKKDLLEAMANLQAPVPKLTREQQSGLEREAVAETARFLGRVSANQHFEEGVKTAQLALLAIQLQEKIDKFRKLIPNPSAGAQGGQAGEGNETLAEIGLIFSMANAVLDAADILGLFGKKGPSFEESVLKILAAIQQQMKALATHLDERFDHVHTHLTYLDRKFSQKMNQIQNAIDQNAVTGDRILAEVRASKEKLYELERQDQRAKADAVLAEITGSDVKCLHGDRKNKKGISGEVFDECMERYASCPEQHAQGFNFLIAAFPPASLDKIFADLSARAVSPENASLYGNYLAQIFEKEYKSSLFSAGRARGETRGLHPEVWMLCAARYLTMARLYPACFASRLDHDPESPVMSTGRLTAPVKALASHFIEEKTNEPGLSSVMEKLIGDYAKAQLALADRFNAEAEFLVMQRIARRLEAGADALGLPPQKHVSDFSSPAHRPASVAAIKAALEQWQAPEKIFTNAKLPDTMFDDSYLNAKKVLEAAGASATKRAEAIKGIGFDTPPHLKKFYIENYPEYVLAEILGFGKIRTTLTDVKYVDERKEEFLPRRFKFYAKPQARLVGTFMVESDEKGRREPLPIFDRTLTGKNDFFENYGVIIDSGFVYGVGEIPNRVFVREALAKEWPEMIKQFFDPLTRQAEPTVQTDKRERFALTFLEPRLGALREGINAELRNAIATKTSMALSAQKPEVDAKPVRLLYSGSVRNSKNGVRYGLEDVYQESEGAYRLMSLAAMKLYNEEIAANPILMDLFGTDGDLSATGSLRALSRSLAGGDIPLGLSAELKDADQIQTLLLDTQPENNVKRDQIFALAPHLKSFVGDYHADKGRHKLIPLIQSGIEVLRQELLHADVMAEEVISTLGQSHLAGLFGVPREELKNLQLAVRVHASGKGTRPFTLRNGVKTTAPTELTGKELILLRAAYLYHQFLEVPRRSTYRDSTTTLLALLDFEEEKAQASKEEAGEEGDFCFIEEKFRK